MRRLIQRKITTMKIVSVTLTWANESDEPEPPHNDIPPPLPDPAMEESALEVGELLPPAINPASKKAKRKRAKH